MAAAMMRVVLTSPLGTLVVAADIILPFNGTLYISCPHCTDIKPVDEFGWRTMPNGEVRNQSHCAACRAKEANATA